MVIVGILLLIGMGWGWIGGGDCWMVVLVMVLGLVLGLDRGVSNIK